ncbi:MAG: discoidin domain-containing protein [Bacteroides sp.]|nr:discoidin domain-containing protein [Bacteroides sp.]MCM1378767.1 discoidin domain-containing protein [Bacteroides sp.]MCM1445384.1 discoidin domain-containing protein [Prevotella sp.]
MKKYLIIAAAVAATSLTSGAYNLTRDSWTWMSSSICSPGSGNNADIVGLEGIHDNNPATCWHSNYLAQSGTPERSNPHWVQIDRGSDRTPFTGLAYLPRQSSSNTSCTAYYVYLSDTDMSDTPATSASDIIAKLGYPSFMGNWSADSSEKYVDFDEAKYSRYILFVNVSSASSSSAACAEMNLYYGSTSGDDKPDDQTYNAISITPFGSNATPHRIAIRGDKLSASVVNGFVRLGNEYITVEYDMNEVARFAFEQYDFDEGQVYVGDKKDIDYARYNVTVQPAAGQVKNLDEILIRVNKSRKLRLNPDVDEPITLMRGAETMMLIDKVSLADFACETGYAFSNLGIVDPGTYTFNIPDKMFITGDGARSSEMNREWVIPAKDGINGINAADRTLTFDRRGTTLIVGGVYGNGVVELYNVGGQCVASALANSLGEAELAVGSLGKGVYFLTANGLTLKIIH